VLQCWNVGDVSNHVLRKLRGHWGMFKGPFSGAKAEV
jgi:hypothetical protein